jgi:hypothetical protein
MQSAQRGGELILSGGEARAGPAQAGSPGVYDI